MTTGILERFALPVEAVQDLTGKPMRQTRLGDGVELQEVARDIVPHRFIRVQVKNEEKSRLARFPVKEPVILCEWIIDKTSHPTEQVRFLPEDLLAFDDWGEVIGGLYKASYERFMQGLAAPGLPLNRWGVLTDSQISSLADYGIFTVEEFAAQPRQRIEGKFPKEYHEAFEEAILYVRGADTRTQNESLLNELAQERQQREELTKTLAEQQKEIERQKEQLALILAAADEKRMKSGKEKGRKDNDRILSESD